MRAGRSGRNLQATNTETDNGNRSYRHTTLNRRSHALVAMGHGAQGQGAASGIYAARSNR